MRRSILRPLARQRDLDGRLIGIIGGNQQFGRPGASSLGIEGDLDRATGAGGQRIGREPAKDREIVGIRARQFNSRPGKDQEGRPFTVNRDRLR